MTTLRDFNDIAPALVEAQRSRQVGDYVQPLLPGPDGNRRVSLRVTKIEPPAPSNWSDPVVWYEGVTEDGQTYAFCSADHPRPIDESEWQAGDEP